MTNTSCEHFRAIATQAALTLAASQKQGQQQNQNQAQNSHTVILTPKAATALDVGEGDFIRMLAM